MSLDVPLTTLKKKKERKKENGPLARQAALSTEFSRQEYWSEFPCPPPGDLSDPGIEPMSPALAGWFFTSSATWEALSASY